MLYSRIEFFAEAVRVRNWIPAAFDALWLMSLAAVAVAAGRPSFVRAAPLRDASVAICIDTSGSMASRDVWPTRAAAAKTAAGAFIHTAPAGIKLAVVAFAKNARIVSPLTGDRTAMLRALEEIPAPGGATAIGDALAAAATQLRSRGHRALVVITDGVNNAGSDPNTVVKTLAGAHVAIFTVGVGTKHGDVMAGTHETATIDEAALRAYARSTGGYYVRAQTDRELLAVLTRLARTTMMERRAVDCALIFAIGGACVMALAFLLGSATGTYP
ncbi:MAG: VWA domain-containing protein [Candidatus Eremiobacteraeota bacterium]|nr:VWA domain-containing protein [Candidatus Eremiobacteraeota bacterium]